MVTCLLSHRHLGPTDYHFTAAIYGEKRTFLIRKVALYVGPTTYHFTTTINGK